MIAVNLFTAISFITFSCRWSWWRWLVWGAAKSDRKWRLWGNCSSLEKPRHGLMTFFYWNKDQLMEFSETFVKMSDSRCDSAIAGCSISQSSVEAFSGGRSLFVEGRTAKWSGPVAGIQSNMWVWKLDVRMLWGYELSESGLDISAIRGAVQLDLSWAIKASPGFIYQWTIRKDIMHPYFIWIHRPIGRPKLMAKKKQAFQCTLCTL